MLTVTYAECHIKAPYAECRYAECRYAECRYAECRGAKCAYVIFYNIFCYFHVPVPAAVFKPSAFGLQVNLSTTVPHR
jgi:hypothetical protein